METNVVIKALYEHYKKALNEEKKDQTKCEHLFISGSIISCGTVDCSITDFPESVYGFAVKVEKDKKEEVFKKLFESNNNAQKRCKHNQIIAKKADEWLPLGGSDYYPLYWGKSKYLMYRIFEHTKSHVGVGSLWLHRNKALEGRNVIFGSILCYFSEEIEKSLQNSYKPILKTHSEPKKEKNS